MTQPCLTPIAVADISNSPQVQFFVVVFSAFIWGVYLICEVISPPEQFTAEPIWPYTPPVVTFIEVFNTTNIRYEISMQDNL